jgi:hypothetical protein
MRTRLFAVLVAVGSAGGAMAQGVPFVGVGSNGLVLTGTAAALVSPRLTAGTRGPAQGPLAGLPPPPAFGYQAYPDTGRWGPALPPAAGGFRDYGYGPGSYVPGR